MRQLQGSKEIAEQLGIEKSTVDSYLTEAVKVLGARNRRDAALQLEQHERAVAAAATPLISVTEPTSSFPAAPIGSVGKVPMTPSMASPVSGAPTLPHKMGGYSARLAPTPDPLPFDFSPDGLAVGQPVSSIERAHRFSGIRLPYRRKGQTDNDLSVGDRLIWIQIIAVGAAVGFGMLATGLQVLTELVESVTRHLS